MTQQTKSTRSILFADDELGFRDLFRFIFEPLGFEVVVVGNGLEALEMIRRRSFNLVVLDVNMPRMGGPETLTRLREIQPDQRVMVVCSGFDPTNRIETEALRAGAASYLHKPIEVDELVAAVNKALEE